MHLVIVVYQPKRATVDVYWNCVEHVTDIDLLIQVNGPQKFTPSEQLVRHTEYWRTIYLIAGRLLATLHTKTSIIKRSARKFNSILVSSDTPFGLVHPNKYLWWNARGWPVLKLMGFRVAQWKTFEDSYLFSYMTIIKWWMCDDDDDGGFLLNAFEMNSSSFVPDWDLYHRGDASLVQPGEHSHSRNGYLIVSGHGSRNSDNYCNQFGLLLLYLTLFVNNNDLKSTILLLLLWVSDFEPAWFMRERQKERRRR